MTTRTRLQCPTCLERNHLPEAPPGTRPCEACGKKPRRFTYFDRKGGIVFSWCEDIECQWEVADILGLAKHCLGWCSCTEMDLDDAILTRPSESLIDTVKKARKPGPTDRALADEWKNG